LGYVVVGRLLLVCCLLLRYALPIVALVIVTRCVVNVTLVVTFDCYDSLLQFIARCVVDCATLIALLRCCYCVVIGYVVAVVVVVIDLLLFIVVIGLR